MPKSDDLHRAGIVTPRRGRIHGPLSQRTRERNHQVLENRLIHAPAVVAANEGAIYRHARLGGTFNFYYHQAA
jgi:hypothetical protein